MNIKSELTFRSMIIIFTSIILGITLPYFIFNDNLLIFQLIFTSVFFLSTYLYLNKLVKKEVDEIAEKFDEFYDSTDVGEDLYRITKEDFQTMISMKQGVIKFLDSFKNIISYQGGVITNYSEIQQELEFNNKAKEATLNITNQLLNLESDDKLYTTILEETLSLMPHCDNGSFLVHDGHGTLNFKALIGYGENDFSQMSIRLNESFLWIASNGKISTPISINGLREFNEQHMSTESFQRLDQKNFFQAKSVLSCPIIINDEFYGMINIDSDQSNAFTNNDVKTMTYFTSQIGMAIKNHELLQKIVQLSRFDKLTEIFNRSYFEELFLDYTKKTMRYREKFALVLCDLNHLKKINDSFGHAAGDLALKTFVSLLKSNIRETDYIARIGGDEFIIILHQNDYDQALEKMNALQESINKEYILYNNVKIPLRFSYGIATSPDESMIYDILSKIADDRMYENKRIMKEKFPTLMG